MMSRATFFKILPEFYSYELSTQKTKGDWHLWSGKGKPIEKRVWIKLMENIKWYKCQRKYSTQYEYKVFLLQRYEQTKQPKKSTPEMWACKPKDINHKY